MLEASAAAREWAIRKLVPVATIAQVDVRIESIIHLGREPLSGNQGRAFAAADVDTVRWYSASDGDSVSQHTI